MQGSTSIISKLCHSLGYAGATKSRNEQSDGLLVGFSCSYGRAECGPTKIRAVGLPIRSGAETAYTSIDGWPKASGSPTISGSIPDALRNSTEQPREAGLAQPKIGGARGRAPPIRPSAKRCAPLVSP